MSQRAIGERVVSRRAGAPGQLIGWVSRNSALVALVITFTTGSLLIPTFLTRLNLSAILYQYSIIGFLALGQFLVILTAGIDLSQGSMLALTSIVTASLMQNYGVPIAVAGGLAASTFLGLVNGLLVSRTKIPAFVVTLGMLGIARGLALLVSDSQTNLHRDRAIQRFWAQQPLGCAGYRSSMAISWAPVNLLSHPAPYRTPHLCSWWKRRERPTFRCGRA